AVRPTIAWPHRPCRHSLRQAPARVAGLGRFPVMSYRTAFWLLSTRRIDFAGLTLALVPKRKRLFSRALSGDMPKQTSFNHTAALIPWCKTPLRRSRKPRGRHQGLGSLAPAPPEPTLLHPAWRGGRQSRALSCGRCSPTLAPEPEPVLIQWSYSSQLSVRLK